MAIWNSLGKYRDTGLLILRVGLGVMMIMHGLPKLQGGPELWAGVGKSMGNIGIHFMPTFWGFMAAATETVVVYFYCWDSFSDQRHYCSPLRWSLPD